MSHERLRVAQFCCVNVFILAGVSLSAYAVPADPSAALRALVLSPEWSIVFHLLIFFIIFFGIAARPLKEKFGRAGTAVAVGFALLLSAGLAVTGRLRILALEPIAGVGLFTLLGVIVGAAFRKLHETSWATTAAISFVAGYGTMRLAAPSLLPAAEELFLIPALLYVLAIVWLVYAFGARAFPADESGTSWLGHAWHRLATPPPGARPRPRESAQAQEALAGVTSQELQEHEAVLAELDETERALRVSGPDETDLRAAVAERLRVLTDTQRRVEVEFAQYRALAQRTTELDVAGYADLRRSLDLLPDTVKEEARVELRSLNEKLATDRVLANLGRAVASNNIAVRDALLRAKMELEAGRVKSCLEALDEARAAEQQALRLMARIQRFAAQLKSAAAKVIAQAETQAAKAAATRAP